MVNDKKHSKGTPEHVAIIMDGNGRWATSQGKPAIAGHKAGAEVAREIARAASKAGVKYLTLYTFSTENWLRPESWVKDMMGLLKYYLENKVDELIENDVVLRIVGDKSRFTDDMISLLNTAEERTKDNQGLVLQLALSYGSREEITQATRQIAQKFADKALSLEDIDEHLIAQHLYTAGCPDPDLLIRTSGEERLSNYLLWQLAYAEFYFTGTLWPDFTAEEFNKAIEEYKSRDRRYGATVGRANA